MTLRMIITCDLCGDVVDVLRCEKPEYRGITEALLTDDGIRIHREETECLGKPVKGDWEEYNYAQR